MDREELRHLFDLTGRTAVVTGGTRGIGLAIAEGLAAAGLLSFTRSMAAAYASDGVRVNALAPGAVDTDMMRKASEAFQRNASAASLQKRMATPAEMIGPVLLLVSDAGSFITGQVLVVDGGMVAR